MPEGKGWEHAHDEIKIILLLNSARGVIIGSQGIVTLIALLVSQLQLDTFDIILLSVDGIALVITAFNLRLREKESRPSSTTCVIMV